jgi:hypothetical protein
MNKSDKSIHTICIAKIKRSTFKPYDFLWTKFYELNSTFYEYYPNIKIDILENELIICSTIIDLDNYSILTTQKLLTQEKGKLFIGDIITATDKLYGEFKGHKNNPITFGQIQLSNGEDLKYFIETGNASMIMIHGIRTILRTKTMSNTQVENLPKIWGLENDQNSR